ncbi:multiple sugar transport system permease protein [Curtobacterium sp. PhB130]|uniref:carbohydrate ABC transporter permease n=1 Tax=unclassified Curtobacterium TaxID=257496 RepID=UPI000F4D2760|nr:MULTISPECIES: carbohydrate ABC transporter permease [unclassified Curtobacterium]ROP63721.1 multiple sugar transport system permease protein [Curtobacterium sp. ZW137]ROS77954.1 multiple sugar transport system permease protein [Curtobacterium sp. PhB130]
MTAVVPRTRRMPLAQRVPLLLSRIAWYLLCALLAVSMLLPLVWMLSIALKSNGDINQIPPSFFPKEFDWSNFVTGPNMIDFYRLLLNTAIVTVLSTAGAVVSSMVVGYGISRIDFPGRKLWFALISGSLFVPGIVGLIPLQHLYISLGLIDTWVPLVLPAFFGSPIFVFLARQYYQSIPRYLDESALIDGAGHWTIFTKIMLPITKPVSITIAIMSFQLAWNDYLNPLVYLQTGSKFTLSLGMASFLGDTAGSQYNYYMATNLLFMLPPLALFFLAQRYFMEGIGSLGTISK